MTEPEMSKIHEKLSVQCFNKAMEFTIKPTRTPGFLGSGPVGYRTLYLVV